MVAKYPAIPAPTAEAHALRSSGMAIKETIEVLTRQRGNPQHSAVTFDDLLTMGLITSAQFPTALGGDPKAASNVAGVAGVSAITLLETITFAGAASYSTSVSWAGYNHIKFIISNMIASAIANTPVIQYHSSGAYQTTSYVTGATIVPLTGTPAFGAAVTSTTAICIYGGTDIIAADIPEGASFDGMITNIASTTMHKYTHSIGPVRSTTTAFIHMGSGVWTGGLTAIDGLKVFMGSGANINSGTLQIYGVL